MEYKDNFKENEQPPPQKKKNPMPPRRNQDIAVTIQNK